MMKVVAFLTTFCILATYGVPLLQNSLLLTEHENYLISSVELTYIDAYASCKSYGYTLAMERSAEETAALNAAITAAEVTSHIHYIGGYRKTDGVFEPEWIWLETGEAIDYSNWYNNQHDYSCLMKMDLLTYNLTWLSTDCSAATHHFICQKDVD